MGRVYKASGEDREKLREPRGEVFEGEELIRYLEGREFHRLVAVGDRVSIDLAQGGIHPDIAVVDGRIQREEISEEELEVIRADEEVDVENPRGGVTGEAWGAAREAFAKTCTTMLRVEGEEDLLALPAITYASQDSVVVYGQRGRGAVVLEPVEELKGFVRGLVDRARYGKVIAGGSWDRFHAGHQSLLLEAISLGDSVDVGVTSDRFLESKLGHSDFQDFPERKRNVEEFLERYGKGVNARTLEIDDFRGNALQEGDAVLATGETLGNARRINQEREENGREALDVVQVPLVEGFNEKPVSSSLIRAGEMDGNGLQT